jgi:hypothetical protein
MSMAKSGRPSQTHGQPQEDGRDRQICTSAMIQAGADILLFFNPEVSDPKEYAENIYRAMVEVSDSES